MMNNITVLTMCLLFAGPAFPAPEGFIPLFNGENSDGWVGQLENHSFSNGVIQCLEEKSGMLLTERLYSDFIVMFEFKLPPGGNNGLVIRYPGYGNAAYSGMCELQILDNTAPKYAKLDTRQYHGSAYGMVAAKRGYLKPVGEWNSQTITVVGSAIKVELNGTIILDTDLSTVTEFMQGRAHPGKDLTRGHFGFTGHNSPVAFRNIYIKEL